MGNKTRVPCTPFEKSKNEAARKGYWIEKRTSLTWEALYFGKATRKMPTFWP